MYELGRPCLDWPSKPSGGALRGCSCPRGRSCPTAGRRPPGGAWRPRGHRSPRSPRSCGSRLGGCATERLRRVPGSILRISSFVARSALTAISTATTACHRSSLVLGGCGMPADPGAVDPLRNNDRLPVGRLATRLAEVGQPVATPVLGVRGDLRNRIGTRWENVRGRGGHLPAGCVPMRSERPRATARPRLPVGTLDAAAGLPPSTGLGQGRCLLRPAADRSTVAL